MLGNDFLILTDHMLYELELRWLQSVILHQCDGKEVEFGSDVSFCHMHMDGFVVVRVKHESESEKDEDGGHTCRGYLVVGQRYARNPDRPPPTPGPPHPIRRDKGRSFLHSGFIFSIFIPFFAHVFNRHHHFYTTQDEISVLAPDDAVRWNSGAGTGRVSTAGNPPTCRKRHDSQCCLHRPLPMARG